MKTLLSLRSLFGGILSVLMITTNAQWVDVTGTTTGASDLQFITINSGIVFSSDANSLYRTDDGGFTWNNISGFTGAATLHDVYMYDLNTLFASTDVGSFRSSDGGMSWTLTAAPTAAFENVGFLHFFSNSYGIGSDRDSIRRTGDGTDTWNGIFSNVIGFGGLFPNDVSFTGDTGIIAGFDGTFAYQGAFARTTDAGSNWTLTVIPQTYTDMRSIEMVSGSLAYATTGSWENHLMQTTDGGVTWDSLWAEPSGDQLMDISMYDPQNGYLITDNGKIYVTTDGTNFTLEHTEAGMWSSRIQVIGNTAYVVGANKILKLGTTTGIDPVEELSFSFCPNPSDGAIQLTSEHGGSIEILTSSGHLVTTEHVFPGTSELDLSHLATGLYFLRRTGSTHVHKLIIK